MTGAWRFAIAASTAGLLLSPAAAFAQAAQTSAPPPASRTPAPIVAPPVQNAPVLTAPGPTPAPAAAAAPTAEPTSPPAKPFAPLRGLPLWPWIAAAIALAGGAGFLLWRRRPREMA